MATYLVTGGCGFIGSHLADALIARGDRVRIIDNLSTGKLENAPRQADIIRGDITDEETLARAMAGVDGCFHLAAVASVLKSVEYWVETHRTNMLGTVAVFNAARDTGNGSPVPVVYASSAAVYGDDPDIPLNEDAHAHPLSSYGVDKLGNEMQGRIAWHTHGVATTGMRFFNVYGPRQDPGSPYSGVISILIDRISLGKPVTIFGDGDQTRDFIYVGDVVRALIAGLETGTKGARVFNVCTGKATSVNDLAKTVTALFGVDLRADYQPPRPGDVRHSQGSCERARRELGVVSRTPLESGLRDTLAWSLENKGQEA